jgi:TPR repeat protein
MRAALILLLLTGCATPNNIAFSDAIANLNAGRNQLAMNQFIACASEGYSACMHNMGWMWEHGRIQGPDRRSKAIGWYHLAARYGNQLSRVALVDLGSPVPAADLVQQPQQVDPETQKAMNEAALALGNLIGQALVRKK